VVRLLVRCIVTLLIRRYVPSDLCHVLDYVACDALVFCKLKDIYYISYTLASFLLLILSNKILFSLFSFTKARFLQALGV